MQIKTEKDRLPYKKIALGCILIFCVYALIAFGSHWIHGDPYSEAGIVRWVNLLLLPMTVGFLLSRTARKANIRFTHLTQKDRIQQRLVEVLREEGYRISESRSQQLDFSHRFPLWSWLGGQPPFRMQYDEDYILLQGPWSKIHYLEKLAYEGEIFYPNPR